METQSIQLTNQQIKDLLERYSNLNYENPPAYAKYHLKGSAISIVIYNSNKVVFQGAKAKEYARPYQIQQELILPQAGSDETGTGSYFGPVVVVAALVDEEVYKSIKHLKLTDSKVISDQEILKLAPLLRKQVPHSLLILNNPQYNQVQKTHNKNSILAKMHNQAYLNLIKKGYKLPNLVVVDQFLPANNYYRYLSDETDVYRNIQFETKAESKYLSVAVASIIAREAFLKTLEQMGEYFDFDFLSGAGTAVDECGREFVKIYGPEKLNQVAKIHFANTKKIIK